MHMKSTIFIATSIVVAASLGFGQPLHYQTILSPAGSRTIVRRPAPSDFRGGQLESVPAYDPKKAGTPFQIDLRSFDLSLLNVGDRLADLLHADFDSHTRWPAKLPQGFDPARIMELGKDPGLRVRQLHAKGVTGRGVGIGIIDQTLLVDHVEFRDRLRLYEEIHAPNSSAEMHGAAVASIAVGKTVGVAPESDLYYIADSVYFPTDTPGSDNKWDYDFTWLAKSVDRLLEVNAGLPKENKIRVISISVGWTPQKKGYQEVMAAVERAKKEGVFVLSTALEGTYSLAFHGLGREPSAEPNSFASYGPGSWWAPPAASPRAGACWFQWIRVVSPVSPVPMIIPSTETAVRVGRCRGLPAFTPWPVK
jgi:subtilisin family serine protease